MKAIVLRAYHTDLLRAVKSLTTEERELGQPAAHQVKIKVHSTICNPSDLSFLRGVYGVKKEAPVVPGFEGCGIVEGAGSSPGAQALIGKRVAFAANDSLDGSWAEYAIADAGACFPVHEHITDEQAAGMIVNPFTAYGLVQAAEKNGSRAIVISAAASQLAGMIRAFASDKGIRTINIVRESDQVQHLLFHDAGYAMNMRDDDFLQQLTQAIQKEGQVTAVDAVAGGLSGVLAHALPSHSELIVYGSLSDNPINNIDPRDLIFHNKRISGFALGNWFAAQDKESLVKAVETVQKAILTKQIKLKVQRKIPLSRIQSALHQYIGNMSEGKILIMPQMQD